MELDEPTESYEKLLEEIADHCCIPDSILMESIAALPRSAGVGGTIFVM